MTRQTGQRMGNTIGYDASRAPVVMIINSSELYTTDFDRHCTWKSQVLSSDFSTTRGGDGGVDVSEVNIS